jgi:hypothetical protein
MEMKTVTWGATGTHATIKAAWDATTFDDDVLFEQVGTSTEAARIEHKALNGYTIIIRGNGDTVSASAPLFYINTSSAITGKLYIENITASITSSFVTYQCNSTSASSGAELHIRTNNITSSSYSGGAVFVFAVAANGGFSKVNLYQNIVDVSGTATFDVVKITDSVGTSVSGSIEDNIFYSSAGGATGTIVFSSVTFINGNGLAQYSIKRVYTHGFSTGNAIGSGIGSYTVGATTEVYTSNDDSEVQEANRSILFSTDNFVSISSGDTDYLVPKATSVLYTAASQTTNITENTIGYNGVTTTRHTVGCMSTPPQILPPTGVTVTQTLGGVVINWTNTVQAGYEKTYIYYETANSDSLFVAPKATTLSGVTTYTIPYSALTGYGRWYVRLAHGA